MTARPQKLIITIFTARLMEGPLIFLKEMVRRLFEICVLQLGSPHRLVKNEKSKANESWRRKTMGLKSQDDGCQVADI